MHKEVITNENNNINCVLCKKMVKVFNINSLDNCNNHVLCNECYIVITKYKELTFDNCYLIENNKINCKICSNNDDNKKCINICTSHNKNLEAYCCDCYKLTCIDCIIDGSHKLHNLMSVYKAIEEYNTKEEFYLNKAKCVKNDLNSNINKLFNLKEELEENINKKTVLIKNFFLNIKRILEEREQLLISRISKLFNKEYNYLENIKEETNAQLNLIDYLLNIKNMNRITVLCNYDDSANKNNEINSNYFKLKESNNLFKMFEVATKKPFVDLQNLIDNIYTDYSIPDKSATKFNNKNPGLNNFYEKNKSYLNVNFSEEFENIVYILNKRSKEIIESDISLYSEYNINNKNINEKSSDIINKEFTTNNNNYLSIDISNINKNQIQLLNNCNDVNNSLCKNKEKYNDSMIQHKESQDITNKYKNINDIRKLTLNNKDSKISKELFNYVLNNNIKYKSNNNSNPKYSIRSKSNNSYKSNASYKSNIKTNIINSSNPISYNYNSKPPNNNIKKKKDISNKNTFNVNPTIQSKNNKQYNKKKFTNSNIVLPSEKKNFTKQFNQDESFKIFENLDNNKLNAYINNSKTTDSKEFCKSQANKEVSLEISNLIDENTNNNESNVISDKTINFLFNKDINNNNSMCKNNNYLSNIENSINKTFNNNILTDLSVGYSLLNQTIHKIFIFGGKNDKSTYVYNIESNLFEEIKQVKINRFNFKSFFYKDKALILGGRIADDNAISNYTIDDSIYAFDLINYSYKTVSNKLKSSRSNFEAVYCQGRLYVLGGVISNNVSTNNVEYYDKLNSKWIDLKRMLTKRKDFALSLVNDKNIYVFGGVDDKE